ncbi:hypothetical protein Tco_0710959 [Tanacetum coccineum]
MGHMDLRGLETKAKSGTSLTRLIQRISLTGFPAQSVGSSNTDVLDSPGLLVLITGTSQSRQHGKDIKEMDKNKEKPDRTEHGIEKSMRLRVQRCLHVVAD